MSSLSLIRHAQASLFESDYDKLSERGERQARKLGEYLVGQDMNFDEVYTGPRKRHRRTAEIAADCYREAGRPWPEITTLEELDENHVDQIAIHHTEALAAQFPHIHKLAESFANASTPADKQPRFHFLFKAITELWGDGKCDFGIESWTEFKTRVNRGIDHILKANGQGGRKIAAITSVGPVTVALTRAMGCSDEVALATGWRLWNCSLTECVFSGDRFTLDSFNCLPHLRDRREWTYR